MSLTVVLEPHENPRIDPLSNAQRLQWVLEFIRQDLAALPPEALTILGDDLLHAAAPWWVEAGWTDGKTRECTDMPAADVRALQQEIRECVQSVTGEPVGMTEMRKIHAGLAAPRGWVVPDGAARLIRIRFGFGYERIVCVSEGTNDRTAILTGVANLLIEFTDRVTTCQVCGTPFLRQYRQEYCNVRCSNKVRNRRRLDRKTEQGKSQRAGATRSPAAASLTTA
jgi:hypothetical protein